MSAPVAHHAPPADLTRAVNYHFRRALDQVSDGVLILQSGIGDIQGPVMVWGNAAALGWTGIPLPDLARTSLQALLTPESWVEVRNALKTAFGGQPCVCPMQFRTPEAPLMKALAQAAHEKQTGEILSVILTFAAARGERDPAAGGLENAVPAGPNANALAEMTGTQDGMIENVRETARHVAHEFNNALATILLPVQLARRAMPPRGDLFEGLGEALASIRRASDLAKDFLDCFRPRPVVRTLFSPVNLLGRVMRLATSSQNIRAKLVAAPDLGSVHGNECQLEQVMINLIRNACQAMPEGGQLRVRAVNCQVNEGGPVVLPPGPYIQISVRDWGPGIPEEHRRHLFHSHFTTKPEGNGCGLSICYKIIREHGGEIMVRSRVLVGTEFILYLPCQEAAAAAVRPGFEPQAGSGMDFPGMPAVEPAPVHSMEAGSPQPVTPKTGVCPPLSLLVVDDEKGMLRVLAQIARSRGFDVVTAATSDEALQFYKNRLHARNPFGLTLLDLNLRCGRNGFEVFDSIRRMHPEARVVATSGQHGDAEYFRSRGFAGFLPKPYTLECFDAMVRPVTGVQA
ncbi:MAG: response regulator [Verrucomicrobiaceae bacterium]|nr:MAG: response regulator [Verrucomicrobiaceae bacterium]